MDHEFVQAATELDSKYALIFFVEIYIDPNEPDQTYQTWDEVTGAWNDETIVAGSMLARVCNDNVPVVAPPINQYESYLTTKPNGLVNYNPYPVTLVLPQSGTDKAETVQFVIDNVDRMFVDVLRRLHHPLRVSVAVGYVKDIADPAEGKQGKCIALEQRLQNLILQGPVSDKQTITGQLVVDTIMWKKYPNNNEVYTHYNFPGLWGLDDDDMDVDPEFDPEKPSGPPAPRPPPGGSYDYDLDVTKFGSVVIPHIAANQKLAFRFALSDISGNRFVTFVALTNETIAGPCFIVSMDDHNYTTGPNCNQSGTGMQISNPIATDDSFGSHVWVVKKGEYQYLQVQNKGAAGKFTLSWGAEENY